MVLVDVGSWVVQEHGNLAGHVIQIIGVSILQQVIGAHKVVLEVALASTLVELPDQPQDTLFQVLPVLGIGVFLTGPEKQVLAECGGGWGNGGEGNEINSKTGQPLC